MDSGKKVLVVGGGAAGFFAAIRLAELCPEAKVDILEKGGRVLSKVAISGGGRCNVTHHCFEPARLVTFYPRGGKELRGPFHRWQPRDTMDWFERRGVALKTEEDGRVFPVSDDSASIVDCLLGEAQKLGVNIRIRTGVAGLTTLSDDRFEVQLSGGGSAIYDQVLVAAGGLKEGGLLNSIRKLGHSVTDLAPSLFTFHIEDSRLTDLAGISVPVADVSVPELGLAQTGAVLITHWGLSGPGILRLSAWGARELSQADYRFTLCLNWIGQSPSQWQETIARNRKERGKQTLAANPLFGIPRRLWQRLLGVVGISDEIVWGQLPKSSADKLGQELITGEYQVTGKSLNKDEFVTCGGIERREIDFRIMQSRIVPGLYFAGETIDIDGITGGFNFQSAWTTGYLAGDAMGHDISGV